MAKTQNLSDIQPEIAFSEYDFYKNYEQSFEQTELGRIKKLIPLREMAISFGLIEEHPKSLRVKRGRKSFFTHEGMAALAFLKSYTGQSAQKLMDALNGNIHYQIFFGIHTANAVLLSQRLAMGLDSTTTIALSIYTNKGAYAVMCGAGILSPNFDRLFEMALEEEGVQYQVVYKDADLDTITPIIHHTGVTVIKFNGDYQDCQFKNTASELDSYGDRMEDCLKFIFSNFGLITCGWSAQWDKALVNLLKGTAPRYGTVLTYVGEAGEALSSLAAERHGKVTPIRNADSFFEEVTEQVLALEKISSGKKS